MRVGDKIGTQDIQQTHRPAAKGQSAPRFEPSAGEAEPHAAEARPLAIAGAEDVSALFMLQVDDQAPKEKRKRSVRRGLKLLDGLDRIKAQLLIGADQQADWTALAAEYGASRDPNLPPEVANLLDEVDVRVAVELAKRERSGKP